MLSHPLISDALFLVLLLSGIPLIASSLVGLTVSVLQSATSIQESSVSFLAKFCVSIAMLWVLQQWYGEQLVQFMLKCLGSIVLLGKV